MAKMTEEDLADLERKIAIEFPKFKVVNKGDSSFMKFVSFFLTCLTFGKMKTFMTTFTTTIGYTVYVPTDWTSRTPTSRAITLRHERVHMRQRDKYGSFGFSFLYLFVLPCVRAYYRKKFEQEAYEETLRAMYEYYGQDSITHYRDDLVSHFLDASYFWMWTKREDIEKWFDDSVAKVLSRPV